MSDDLERQYRQALELDFIKFTNALMLGYFLKQFTHPEAEMGNVLDSWCKRVIQFRENALKEVCGDTGEEDLDVANILTNIMDLDVGLDRNKTLKEVRDHLEEQMRAVLKTF